MATLLPSAALVVFMREEHESAKVNFGECVDCVGHLMTRVEIYPPSFRVRKFPTHGDLAAMADESNWYCTEKDMTVKVYGPNHLSPQESLESIRSFDERVEKMDVSDSDLVRYIEEYFVSFRSTVEEFFPQIADSLSLYADGPFHTFVVRMGPNGVIIGHRRSDTPLVEVKQFIEISPPCESPNVFDIIQRLKLEHCYMSFVPRSFDVNEAHSQAVSYALSAVLQFFWLSIPDCHTFEAVVKKLIATQGITVAEGKTLDIGDRRVAIDATARVLLQEPASYRRFEDWAFEFKHRRASASDLRQADILLTADGSIDCLCIVTADDLTSISRYVASENAKVRVWDRSILNSLIHKHPDIIRDHFEAFPKAVEELANRLKAREISGHKSAREEFTQRLQQCPSGNEHFTEYEAIGIDVISFLFAEHLGAAKVQSRTMDEKQRRDVLYRNNRTSRLFDRCFHRFGSDVLIVDFKNYGDEITSSVITDVDKYANKALGRFILVVSRKGAAPSVEATQRRVYRDSNTVVLVLSDVDLLEMVERKEREQTPEDVIEDKLDELLRSY